MSLRKKGRSIGGEKGTRERRRGRWSAAHSTVSSLHSQVSGLALSTTAGRWPISQQSPRRAGTVPTRGMKGHHHHLAPLSPATAAKRRCTGMAAAVPALVLCSVLLPLAFLLGLHSIGYGSEERAAVVISTELGLGKHKHLDGPAMKHKLLKDVSKMITSGSNGISGEKSSRSKSRNLAAKSKIKDAFSFVELNNDTSKKRGSHTQRRYQLKDLSWRSMDHGVCTAIVSRS